MDVFQVACYYSLKRREAVEKADQSRGWNPPSCEPDALRPKWHVDGVAGTL